MDPSSLHQKRKRKFPLATANQNKLVAGLFEFKILISENSSTNIEVKTKLGGIIAMSFAIACLMNTCEGLRFFGQIILEFV